MDIRDLKTESAAPVGAYLFAGEEEYLKRHYLSVFRAACVPDPVTETFKYIVFDRPDMDVPALREAVMSPPVMSERKLVVWKYADFGRMRESVQTALVSLLEEMPQYPYSVLVMPVTADGFDLGSLPKRPSKLYKKFENFCKIVDFKKSTDVQLLSWLKKHFDVAGVAADADTLRRLIFRAGHSMDVLHGEVGKLVCYVKAGGRDTLTAVDVDTVVPADPECDAFALSNALSAGDRAAAYVALRELRDERAEPTMVVGMMARTDAELLSVSQMLDEGSGADGIAAALRMNPYKVRLAVSAVKKQGAARIRGALYALGELDVQMKNGGRTDFSVLESFIAGYLPREIN